MTTEVETMECNLPECSNSSDSLSKCSRCKKVSYCNRECQKADWKAHKNHCVEANNNNNDNDNNNNATPTKKRRVISDVVEITGDDMQSQIDTLDDNVRVLAFHGGGFFDHESQPKLTRNLPNLEELSVHDVDMNELHLTGMNCPKLHTVHFENVTQEEEPNFTVELPELRHFTLLYYGPGDLLWLYKMSAAAHKLETFSSYKLRVPMMYFGSHHMKSIRLNRAEGLTTLKLFTPNLVSLDITSCTSLQHIVFIKDHKQLGKDVNTNGGEELEVINDYTILGKHAVKALNEHPRVHQEIDSGDGMDELRELLGYNF